MLAGEKGYSQPDNSKSNHKAVTNAKKTPGSKPQGTVKSIHLKNKR